MCDVSRLMPLGCALAVLLLSAPAVLRAEDGAEDKAPSARPCPAPAPPAPDVLAEANTLRVLFPQEAAAPCAVSHQEQRLLEAFAHAQGSELRWFSLPAGPGALYAALAVGQADLAVGVPPQFDQDGMISRRCASAPAPEAQGAASPSASPSAICHTLPWAEAGEQLLGRVSAPDTLAALRGRQVAVRAHSPAWSSLRAEDTSLIAIPEALDDEQVINRIASGRYDLAVLGSLSLQHYLPAHPDLDAGLHVTAPEPRSWAVLASAWSLHRALDEFIQVQHVRDKADGVAPDDFDSILERRTLRLITMASPEHYYLTRGRQQGFEYELLQGFARQHRLQLEVILADSTGQMHELLMQGKGDVLAATLPESYIRAHPDVSATVHYLHAMPVVVGRRSDPYRLIDPADLPGRRLTLMPGSPWLPALEALQAQGFALDIHPAESGQDVRAILAMIDKGMYDLTVVSARQLAGFVAGGTDLEVKFSLSEPVPLSWATRKDNHQLLAELNRYLGDLYRSADYNVLYRKHFPTTAGRERERPPDPLLSRWDHIVARYAEQHGFDRELIMAMMFQESRFDPLAHSRAGAFGLMQLLPSTQDFLKVQDPAQPEQSIQAGVRYLDYLRQRFEDELMPEERTWFSLAAYNAGLGRVREARHKARQMGLDDKVWFGNVEQAMLALAKPIRRDGKLTRRCRCGETVVYVREIRTRYFNYLRYLRGQDTVAYQGDLDH